MITKSTYLDVFGIKKVSFNEQIVKNFFFNDCNVILFSVFLLWGVFHCVILYFRGGVRNEHIRKTTT